MEVLLEKFTEMTGCPISLANGPEAELEWPEGENNLLAGAGAPDPTQMLIQQLLQVDRHFRDLCVNPVVDALINLMMGELLSRVAGVSTVEPKIGDYQARTLL